MNVEVQLRSSLGTSEGQSELSRIVQSVRDGWHEWLGPDPDDASLTDYFDQFRPHREVLQKSFARALLYPLESERTVTVVEPSDVTDAPAKLSKATRLPLRTAAVLLTEPLSVLVENETNDGAFFRRLIDVVDAQLVGLFDEDRPRIRFENGGGNSVMKSLVEHRAERAVARRLPLRILVIADSDAKYPHHDDGFTVSLRKTCDDLGARIFVLNKRAIENYVTDPVLREYAVDNPNLEPAIAFILGLPSNVRDHYPMKKGIPADNGKVTLPEGPESDLYEGIYFPSETPLKASGCADRFVTTGITHTTADYIARDSLREIELLAQWIRKEL